MRRALSIAWIIVLAALIALGVVSSVKRGISVTSDDQGALDREQLEVIVALGRLEPESKEHERLEREIALSAANLNARPGAAVGHVAAGALFLLLVMLQFSRRLRARHPAVHRWNGRVLLALILVSGLAGMYLGVAEPYGGAWESAATTIFGSWLIFCAARGWLAIRARKMALHREWMIRMFAIAIGISVIRVVGLSALFAFGTEGITASGFAINLWSGWLISVAVAELWILRTRTRRVVESEAFLQPL